MEEGEMRKREAREMRKREAMDRAVFHCARTDFIPMDIGRPWLLNPPSSSSSKCHLFITYQGSEPEQCCFDARHAVHASMRVLALLVASVVAPVVDACSADGGLGEKISVFIECCPPTSPPS